MKSTIIPGIFLAAVAALLHTGVLAPTPAFVSYAMYGATIVGLLLAWRFHSTRIFSALAILFLAQQAISYFSTSFAGHFVSKSESLAIFTVGILLPLDFVLLSLQREKGFGFLNLAPSGLLLFIESVIVAVVCRPQPAVAHAAHRAALTTPLPFAVQLAFAGAAVVLLIRFLLSHKPAESGLFWALAACFLALRFGGVGRIPSVYFAAAGLILAGTIVETSYLLAYHDELTSLPSRRAFHDALLGLTPPYSIAMVDIDHFKRCNDTYGHDTGDQVLRLVASRLARVGGGGRAYRCGGEEFAIVFPGKTTEEVLDSLEELRARIEASSFRLRGAERRQQHGPDGRGGDGSNADRPSTDRRSVDRRRASRLNAKPGENIRKLRSAPPPTKLPSEISVTASIGVATSAQDKTVEEVIDAADKALYRAKNAGRNRIETAASAPRRRRAKGAIA
jgi:diguanylate cyclase (GGDEF)-like protein